MADNCAGPLGDGVIDGCYLALGWLFQKAAGLSLSSKHFPDAPPKVRIACAGLVEIGGTLLG